MRKPLEAMPDSGAHVEPLRPLQLRPSVRADPDRRRRDRGRHRVRFTTTTHLSVLFPTPVDVELLIEFHYLLLHLWRRNPIRASVRLAPRLNPARTPVHAAASVRWAHRQTRFGRYQAGDRRAPHIYLG